MKDQSETHQLVLLPGDGIGPEVIKAAETVMRTAREYLHREGIELSWEAKPIGGAAIEEAGKPLPEETLSAAQAAKAVLLGAVGGPQWDRLAPHERPEAGLLGLRRALSVYANLRPAALLPGLEGQSPLRPSAIQGLDVLLVRELTGGVYFGEPRGRSGESPSRSAIDTMAYEEGEIRRVAHVAFRSAQRRQGRVTSVDKRNVLETSRLWREVVEDVAKEYPDVTVEHQLVDSMAMLLVLKPHMFDVVLTENMFGDILSDELGGVVGSLGVMASASLGDDGPGLYEPVHGSAPDIAGKDMANPLGAILSLAMLAEHSLDLPLLARSIEGAVKEVLRQGLRTKDISDGSQGEKVIGTREMGERVADALAQNLHSRQALNATYF
ncbi:MAG: 3-isopropylmalate dehydrogenase [Thermaerobacter sp.]|nr:3-isopropylmalate dehydrogenase [Thermaerobacter sp.]